MMFFCYLLTFEKNFLTFCNFKKSFALKYHGDNCFESWYGPQIPNAMQYSTVPIRQGWEFAPQFSERIAHFFANK